MVLLAVRRGARAAAVLLVLLATPAPSRGQAYTDSGIKAAVGAACAKDPAVFGPWDTAQVTDAEGLFSATPAANCKASKVRGAMGGALPAGLARRTAGLPGAGGAINV